MTPKWKTTSFTIVGWLGFGLFLLVVVVDIILALIPNLPTLSQYVQSRYSDQPLFGYIIIGMLIWLGFHWFGKKNK